MRCTERQPHRSLALPADRTCEEQVQDVSQRDRDHERDAREEDEECRFERRGEVVLKRRGVCAELRGVLRRELGAQPCGDAVQLAICAGHGGRGREATEHADEVHGASRVPPRVAIRVERHHEIDVADRQREEPREHTDDRIRLAVQPQRAFRDRRVAAERAAPIAISEHHDARRAGSIVGARQQPPERGRGAEDGEPVRRCAQALHPLCAGGSVEDGAPVRVASETHGPGLRAIVEELGQREW